MATKLRALYQRRKGRDLFDLWHVLTDLQPDEQLVIEGLVHYMAGNVFSYHDLSANLAAKIESPDFAADLAQLTTTPLGQYSIRAAADLVMERLGSRLPGSPDLSKIEGGLWRANDG